MSDRSSATPTVSVVIPTHNRPDHLVEAVESAFGQTVDILEVIVVDDASDIDPQPALSRFGNKVHYERLPENSGANVARNRGIDLARGQLVAFLDDDDLWLPEKLETQIAALDNEYEACLCNSQEVGKPQRPSNDTPEVTAARLRHSTPCGTSGLVARHDVLDAERFDPAIPRSQDWDLYVRLVQRTNLAFVGKPLYLRRTGHDGITAAAKRQSPAELLHAAAALRKHREWLGETAYRRRIARTLLTFLSKRPRKLPFLLAAIRHAGIRATLSELTRKVQKRQSPARIKGQTDAV